MLVLKKGENGRSEMNVDTDAMQVESHHVSKHKSLKDSDARYQQCWVIDWSNCTQEQILKEATKSMVITIRRGFAACDKPKNDDWNNKVFDAREFITERKSKVQKMAAVASTLSDAEKAELLAALGVESA